MFHRKTPAGKPDSRTASAPPSHAPTLAIRNTAEFLSLLLRRAKRSSVSAHRSRFLRSRLASPGTLQLDWPLPQRDISQSSECRQSAEPRLRPSLRPAAPARIERLPVQKALRLGQPNRHRRHAPESDAYISNRSILNAPERRDAHLGNSLRAARSHLARIGNIPRKTSGDAYGPYQLTRRKDPSSCSLCEKLCTARAAPRARRQESIRLRRRAMRAGNPPPETR